MISNFEVNSYKSKFQQEKGLFQNWLTIVHDFCCKIISQNLKANNILQIISSANIFLVL